MTRSIVIVTQCYPPTLGGIENLMFHLTKQLHKCGYNIEVHADGKTKGENTTFDELQEFPIHRYSGFKPLRAIHKSFRLESVLRDNQIDTIIVDSWKSLERLPKFSSARTLCLVHGTEISSDNQKKYRRINHAFKKAHYLICNSQFTANLVEGITDSKEKIRVIHPGIPSFSEQHKIENNPIREALSGRSPLLISVGRLQKRKGIDKVIKTIPMLLKSFPRLLYIIAGSGSEYETLQAEVKDLHLQDHVLFLGNISEDEKNFYLKSSDLFILAGNQIKNDVEGFGISIIEAASFQVPALVSETGGVSEAVIHGLTGIVCKDNRAETLCHHIHQLLNDEETMKEMGINAKKRADDLQWSKVIKQYEALF